MENFKGINEVLEYLQTHGWRAKDRDEAISRRTLYRHVQEGLLTRSKTGGFGKNDVDEYAVHYLADESSLIAENQLDSELTRERIRKLKLENDKKSGELVSLSEEIKRRVAVIQDLKSGLINHRATFVRQLSETMKQRHPESETLHDLLIDAAELWEDAVLTVFGVMGQERTQE